MRTTATTQTNSRDKTDTTPITPPLYRLSPSPPFHSISVSNLPQSWVPEKLKYLKSSVRKTTLVCVFGDGWCGQTLLHLMIPTLPPHRPDAETHNSHDSRLKNLYF